MASCKFLKTKYYSYAELVKQNGQDYEPETLKVMFISLNQHIKEKYGFSIISDDDFKLSSK